MRFFILCAALTGACSPRPAAPPRPAVAVGTYVGSGSNRLCVAGEPGEQRAGLIVFARPGGPNCSLAGRIEGSGRIEESGRIEAGGKTFAIVPSGEAPGGCSVPIVVRDGMLAVGPASAACAYYCGPAAQLAGQRFALDATAPRATDLGGDPLC